jgi:hypothetical protein
MEITLTPLVHHFEALHLLRPDITLTLVLPEIVVEHRRHQLLHSRTPQRLRRALRPEPGILITSVRAHSFA